MKYFPYPIFRKFIFLIIVNDDDDNDTTNNKVNMAKQKIKKKNTQHLVFVNSFGYFLF